MSCTVRIAPGSASEPVGLIVYAGTVNPDIDSCIDLGVRCYGGGYSGGAGTAFAYTADLTQFNTYHCLIESKNYTSAHIGIAQQGTSSVQDWVTTKAIRSTYIEVPNNCTWLDIEIDISNYTGNYDIGGVTGSGGVSGGTITKGTDHIYCNTYYIEAMYVAKMWLT